MDVILCVEVCFTERLFVATHPMDSLPEADPGDIAFDMAALSCDLLV